MPTLFTLEKFIEFARIKFFMPEKDLVVKVSGHCIIKRFTALINTVLL
jgi:hypothetical protein